MRIVILGAGPAGLAAAEHLRKLEPGSGNALHITMISAESVPPYSPPAMADHFLSGREQGLFWKGKDICDRLSIEFKPGCKARAVEPQACRVVLEDGSKIDYDRLLIATGSRLYAPLPGCDLPGIYNFKSLAAARELVDHARGGAVRSALVVGAGFIGVEVALLLNSLGLDVTVVESEWLMPRVLDPESAEIVLAELLGRGMEIRLRTTAKAFTGERQAEGVELESGEIIRADAYIAATGVKPHVDYLAGSGLDIGWGIKVDEGLHTGVGNIWAAGDVAETTDRLTGERFVHANFPNAIAQGRVAACRMLGYDVSYEGAEAMNSMKHVGLPLIAVGAASGPEELRWRQGTLLRRIFLERGRIVGFRLVGDIGAAGVYRSLMLRRVDVSRFGPALLSSRFNSARLGL